MANALGTLIVNLKANVADFVSGMGSAAYASKQAGKDIRESFEGLGGILGTVLGPLGEIGEAISATFEKVGSFAGGAATGIGKLGGALGAVGASVGAAVGALAAVEAGAIAIALHGAEAAAQIGELSKKTGVSTEALSGLGFAAKQTGVDQQALSSGLEKLNKSIFAAAVAPASAQNAFTRLGIAVKDSSGNLRSTEDVFADVAEKISSIESPAARGALAIQLFGKGGSELLPLLLEGKSGIDEFLDSAKKFGIVIDEQTAESAHRFEQTLGDIKAAGEGASLQLTQALLPALTSVSTALKDGLTEKGSGISDLIEGVKTISSYFISFGALVALIFKEAGAIVAEFVATAETQFDALVQAAKAAAHLDYGGVIQAANDATTKLDAINIEFANKSKKNWDDYKTIVANAFKDSADSVVSKPKKSGTSVDLSKEDVDKREASIKQQIAALDQQAAASVKLAASTQLSTAAQREQVAANEAAALIQKLNADADKTTGAERTKLIALINAETQAIKANAVEKVVGADITKINEELQKESDGYAAQIAGLEAVSAAYDQGSAAIAAAGIDKQLEKDREKVQLAEAEYQIAANTIGVTSDRLSELSKGVQQANADLNLHAQQLTKIRDLTIENSIKAETNALLEQIPAIAALNAAYLQGAEAVRQAEIGLAVAQFKTANPGATDADVSAFGDNERKKSDLKKQGSINQQASSLNLIQSYNDEIKKLSDVKDALEKNGDSTLLVDAAIYDANDKIIQQYDAAALKVGDFGDKTRAVLNQIALDGKNLGQSIFQAFGSAVTGLEDQLTNLAVTGKANFKELLTSFDKQIVGAGIKKIFSSAASGLNNSLFGGAIPGLGSAKADGSTSAPWYVIPVDSSGNVLSDLLGKGGGPNGDGFSASENAFLDGGSSGSGGAGGGLASVFDGLTSKLSTVFSGLVSSLGSVLGGIGHLFGSAFSGVGGFLGLAGGGSVSPGKSYIVGENGPEIFNAKTAGVISPGMQSSKTHVTHVDNHFYGVTDHDSFKRSESQISAFFASSAAAAQARTRS